VTRFEWAPGFNAAGLQLPVRQTALSAGYDLAAGEDVEIAPTEIRLVRTGVRVLLERGQFMALYARSSLALKRGLLLSNGVGVIDADYYGNADNGGEILVPLWNLGLTTAFLVRGERVAQAVFTRFDIVSGELSPDDKRKGGFGSTSKVDPPNTLGEAPA